MIRSFLFARYFDVCLFARRFVVARFAICAFCLPIDRRRNYAMYKVFVFLLLETISYLTLFVARHKHFEGVDGDVVFEDFKVQVVAVQTFAALRG